MKYDHSQAQSAEYLRLALKRMAQQEAGLHPASYAIWYEYVAGINPDLQANIDSRLKTDGRLNDEATYELFSRYVAGLTEQAALRIGDSVNHLVNRVTASATHAGDQASLFGSSLERWGSSFDQEPCPEPKALAPGVAEILRGTREMQRAISTLQEQLEQSTLEARSLREEVTRAREEALIDALTGLANRKGFDLALATCIDDVQPEAPGPCLLMIDLDHFKRLNDAHGHLFGDKVLTHIGQILRANVKGKDTAARYGGEEFAVILPQTLQGGAIGLAEALRALVAASRVRLNGGGALIGNITVSIGVADCAAGEPVAEFVARADRALYAAKTLGRNRVALAPHPQPDTATQVPAGAAGQQ